MELYAYRENGEFIGTIDFYTSLRWRRQYWTAGEVELHLPATKENLAAIKAGVILRRVGYTESARIMGIKTKGGEITANARMLEIYFSMAYVIGTKSFTGTPAEILCQLAEDARERESYRVAGNADLRPAPLIPANLARAALDLADEALTAAEAAGVDTADQRAALAELEFNYALGIRPVRKEQTDV